jgi:hypothetical protein
MNIASVNLYLAFALRCVMQKTRYSNTRHFFINKVIKVWFFFQQTRPRADFEDEFILNLARARETTPLSVHLYYQSLLITPLYPFLTLSLGKPSANEG